MPTIELGNRIITETSLPYIIAEIGVNHGGSIKKAKELVLLAKEGGADAVKFQTYKAETLASRNSPSYWDLNKEPTTSQYELFKRYDNFGSEEYIELAHFCESNEITFLSTPFDDNAIDFLEDLMPFYKIASADITNTPFLRKIAQKNKPVLLSTGASTIEEIELALGTLKKAGCKDISLLHCILNYPTEIENANLGMIEELCKRYPEYVIGYSDHTLPDQSMTTLLTAYLKGACIIEKHFTYDKTLQGNDHYHAMDAEDLKVFLCQVKKVKMLEGSSKKEPLQTELISRKNARRSIVLAEAVQENTILTEGMLTYKRPGIGISPIHWDHVIGMQVMKPLDVDHVLQWEDLVLNKGTKTKVIAVIQARMGSSRFPGKMMADLAGKPLIEWIFERVGNTKFVDEFVLATSTSSKNDVLEEIATKKGILTIRGDEEDVLSRFAKAARELSADIIVRVCADNPFIDPAEIDKLIKFFIQERPDYAFNHLNRMNNQYADGFGAEILTRAVLEDMDQCCIKQIHREHVTMYLWDNPHAYQLMTIQAPEKLAYPELRFDVDRPEDLEALKPLAEKVGIEGDASDFINAKLIGKGNVSGNDNN